MVIFDSPEYWQAHTWDRYAELERVPQAVKREFLKQEELTVSTVLPLVNGEHSVGIMDLACGTGRIAESVLQAASAKGTVTMALVDFNPRTLELARHHLKGYQNVSFLVADAYDIGDLTDGCFDIVICLELLHHISNLKLLFAQIKRILKPGGLLITNVLATESYAEWDRLKYGRLKSWRRQLLCFLSERVYRRSPDVLKTMIRRLGLARLEPLSREQLVASMEPYFEVLEVVTSYYHWVRAETAQ